jgi:hypothetical protein
VTFGFFSVTVTIVLAVGIVFAVTVTIVLAMGVSAVTVTIVLAVGIVFAVTVTIVRAMGVSAMFPAMSAVIVTMVTASSRHSTGHFSFGRMIHPVAPLVVHDVWSDAREEQNHEGQSGDQEIPNNGFLNVKVHEVLSNKVGLVKGDTKGRNQGNPQRERGITFADDVPDKWADDAYHEQAA